MKGKGLLSEAEGGKYRKGWGVGKIARRMSEKAQGCMLLTISLLKKTIMHIGIQCINTHIDF